jgi:hypothetical protein
MIILGCYTGLVRLDLLFTELRFNTYFKENDLKKL